MERIKVISSNIKTVGYDEANKILEIEFMNGGIYQYEKVEKEVHENFLKSESLGKFFYKNIKSNREIKFKKIELEPTDLKIAEDVTTQSKTEETSNKESPEDYIKQNFN